MFFIATAISIATTGPRANAAQRKLFVLSQYAAEALVGLLISDAWLQRTTPDSNARLGFAQSGKPEKRSFFDRVWSLFSPFCTTDYVPSIKTFKRNGYDTVLSAITFVTIRLPCFNYYFNLFYVNGVKVVPAIIGELLTPVGLAF